MRAIWSPNAGVVTLPYPCGGGAGCMMPAPTQFNPGRFNRPLPRYSSKAIQAPPSQSAWRSVPKPEGAIRSVILIACDEHRRGLRCGLGALWRA